MRRGAAAALLVVALLSAASATGSVAQPQSGPEISFARWNLANESVGLYRFNFATRQAERIFTNSSRRGGASFLTSSASWFGDGERLVFDNFGKGGGFLYSATAEGTVVRRLPRTRMAGSPVVSPDGRIVAFSRSRFRLMGRPSELPPQGWFESTTTWLLDVESRTAKRLTPWRNRLYVTPDSFSSDGQTLIVSQLTEGKERVQAVDLHGGPTMTWAANATEGALAPDGTRLAFIRDHDLYVRSLTTGLLTRLTRTELPESGPAWDPGGERIAYLRDDPLGEEIVSLRNRLMQVNADGTCARLIAKSRPLPIFEVFASPAWRPGPGREAGPIVC